MFKQFKHSAIVFVRAIVALVPPPAGYITESPPPPPNRPKHALSTVLNTGFTLNRQPPANRSD